MNVVAHRNAQKFVRYGTGELVTVMEPISFTGVAGNSLFIYRGKHILESWFPSNGDESAYTTLSETALLISSCLCIAICSILYTCIVALTSERFFYSKAILI